MVDNLEIENIDEVYSGPSEGIAVAFEFKSSLNAYLKDLVASPVRSLADVIAFNNKHSKLVSAWECKINQQLSIQYKKDTKNKKKKTPTIYFNNMIIYRTKYIFSKLRISYFFSLNYIINIQFLYFIK